MKALQVAPQDGTFEEGDFLIGCDGVHSFCRRFDVEERESEHHRAYQRCGEHVWVSFGPAFGLLRNYREEERRGGGVKSWL
jgi:2-polyprenyl-6-methoxyphenol hydroxylase-like FAD-dependent oxidoreductase